ncbi:MAG TPA: tetratricopeptide repeat protein [Puia sp.]|jgi:tetratricopeptide (TPR) repeat protein|nr:tetratricopeptide repeat protein [Puia sp.]
MEKIEKLLTFLSESPDDPFLKHALGLEYIKIGQEQRARQLFAEILDLDPSYIGTYYHYARLLERAGELEAAKDLYEKGMIAAKNANETHAFNELKAAYEDLIY